MRCSVKGSQAGSPARKHGARQRGRLRTPTCCDQLGKIGIRERINELKEANSRKAMLSREQTIEFLCNVINTSAAKVEADSSLVQSAEFMDGKPVKLRIPDKIAAVKELTKMCGWAQPERFELSATDTLTEFVRSIREAPRRPGHGGLLGR